MNPFPAAAVATRARQLFFENGTTPDGLINDAILRSWQRCERQGRKAGEAIVFDQVRPGDLNELLQRHQQLLRAAQPAIHQLAQSMSGTGYGIILTDSAGVCLAAHGPIDTCGDTLRMALRRGVNLSEDAIGTNAMCASIVEARLVCVFGGEHYFSQHESFQCIAAPIFGSDGRLLGAIDISRDVPGPQFGTVSMMLDCAAMIENALLMETRAHVVVGLHWRADAGEQFGQALMSFGEDGEILAMNRGASRLLGLSLRQGSLGYTDLFCGNFGALQDRMASGLPTQLTLHSGLRIFARAPSFERSGARVARKVVLPASRPQSAPEFGDNRVHAAFNHAIRALNAGLPVMISGETGTGKEVAARALHEASARASGPFVAINCGAIPRELIEGELFGYADGAFTGARRGGAKGRIEEADGGTLFLDEIGDMPLDLQTRLLRVLETRQVTRLGESKPRELSIQLLSATHLDLEVLVREQRFRSDLYFRLSGMPLRLPALRERSDLGALIDTLLVAEGIAAERLAPPARAALLRHSWPGNARELRTALRFANAMAGAEENILYAHLPQTLTSTPAATPLACEALLAAQDPAPASRSLREIEWESIGKALAAADGNVTAAARQLGISRATLHRRLKEGAPRTPATTPE